jgi:hypothetical protein
LNNLLQMFGLGGQQGGVYGGGGYGSQAGPSQTSSSQQNNYATLGTSWNPNAQGNWIGQGQANAGQAAATNPSLPGMPNTLNSYFQNLTSNPSGVTGSPVYAAIRDQLMKKTQRQLSAARMSKSSNALDAFAGAGQQAYGQAFEQLMNPAMQGAQVERQQWQAGANEQLGANGLSLEATLGAAQGNAQSYNTLINERQGDLSSAMAVPVTSPWGMRV